jgi:hypothetical protein
VTIRYLNTGEKYTQTLHNSVYVEQFKKPEVLSGWKSTQYEKVEKANKGVITYKLDTKSFTGSTLAEKGKTYKVAVKPMARTTFHQNATELKKDENYSGAKSIKGAKVKYQWYYRSYNGKWTKIKDATKKSYKVSSTYAGYPIGVIFTVSKKGYTSTQGFANTLYY